tara:strand:- start:316 stop:564 length:249 start_codon:yes stop_codon:yes gene_type:complete
MIRPPRQRPAFGSIFKDGEHALLATASHSAWWATVRSLAVSQATPSVAGMSKSPLLHGLRRTDQVICTVIGAEPYTLRPLQI